MIGLIGAMPLELEQLSQKVTEKKENQIGMDAFISGKLFGKDAVLAICGPGKVNAALCALEMIEHFHPEQVLNLGVAGAGCDEVGIGDMVIATCAVQHDMDTSPIGDPVGYVSKIGLVQLPCDKAFHDALVTAAKKVPDVHVFEGVVATGDQFVCDGASRARIHDTFDAMAVEMEGAAIAHACYMHGVKCGILRSISDQANGQSTMDYPTFSRLAASHSEQVVEHLLREGEL